MPAARGRTVRDRRTTLARVGLDQLASVSRKGGWTEVQIDRGVSLALQPEQGEQWGLALVGADYETSIRVIHCDRPEQARGHRLRDAQPVGVLPVEVRACTVARREPIERAKVGQRLFPLGFCAIYEFLQPLGHRLHTSVVRVKGVAAIAWRKRTSTYAAHAMVVSS